MHLITVIPIKKAIGKETLTYFSAEAPLIGSLVNIPLRGKKTWGIVVFTEKAELKKTEIKNLPYGIRKMDMVRSKSFLLPQFIEGARLVADYYASTTGAVLSVLIPQAIFEYMPNVEIEKGHKEHAKETRKEILSGETLAFQASYEERISTYRSTIREEFAKKQSIFICLPSREELRVTKEALQKGIEQYTFVLHNGLNTKEISQTWKKILETEHPVLIIATGYFLSLPRLDIHTVIIEREHSRGYVLPARPFLDFREVAHIIGKKMGWRVIFSDTILRTETIFREKNHDINAFTPLKFRVPVHLESEIIDMRKPKDQERKEFEIIGSKLAKLLQKTIEENARMVLFCSRKGLAPITVCEDCGQTVSCTNCGAPTVLHKKKDASGKEKNIFICHICGKKDSSEILCTKCGGWRLTPLGIGIESTERELKKKFPDINLFIMDKDHVKTQLQAEKTIQKFFDTPGSFLVCTELALPYMTETVEYTGIASLDSLFAIPDWKMKEKIFDILITLRTLTNKDMLVQTRRPEDSIFEYALKGNIIDFYREEIEERERYGYPPFNTFIKISLEGPKSVVRPKLEKIKEDFLPYKINIFEGFYTRGSAYVAHGLIMLSKGDWPDPILLAKLRTLPPQYVIKIDPDSLL